MCRWEQDGTGKSRRCCFCFIILNFFLNDFILCFHFKIMNFFEISDDSALLFCVIFVCRRLDHRLIFFSIETVWTVLAFKQLIGRCWRYFPPRNGQGRGRGQEGRSRCHGGDREDGQRLLQVESELEGYMEISQICPPNITIFSPAINNAGRATWTLSATRKRANASVATELNGCQGEKRSFSLSTDYFFSSFTGNR